MEFVFPPNFGGIVVDGVFIAADNDADAVDADAFVDIHVRDGLDVETCTGISDMLECLKFLSFLACWSYGLQPSIPLPLLSYVHFC